MKISKARFAAFFTALFAAISIFNYLPAGAAVTKPAVPKIRFVNAPVTEYTVGDRVKFDIQSPGYSGKVEYRVVLWNNAKKSYGDLWHAGNGYPTRYYTKWQPTGGTTFNLGWIITEPGDYRITVYAKRVGIPGNKAAIPGANCDSYMESVAFKVKPRLMTLDKEGETYGSSDPNNLATLNTGLEIKAKNISYNNSFINGDVYLLNGDISLKNLHISGTLYVNPGEYETVNLEGVSAGKILIQSGKPEGYDLNHVSANELTVDTNRVINIKVTNKTTIFSTILKNDVIITGESGSLGKVYIANKKDGAVNAAVKGINCESITIQGNASLEQVYVPSKPLALVKLAPSGIKDAAVSLKGAFNTVEIYSDVSLYLDEDSGISLLDVFDSANIFVSKNASIDTLYTRYTDKYSYVFNEGTIKNANGNFKYVTGREVLPKDGDIEGIAYADVYFGREEGFLDKNYISQPVLRMRLHKEDGSLFTVSEGRDAYIDTKDAAIRYRYAEDTIIYSWIINSDDGSLQLPGGSYSIYIPAENNKWYKLDFTTRQMGQAGEVRSIITSINGNAFTYPKWSMPKYTISNRVTLPGYIAIGSELGEVEKIMGKPTSTYSYDNTEIEYYYKSGYMGGSYYKTTSTIHMVKKDGKYIVTNWDNQGNLKVNMGQPVVSAPYFKLGSLKEDVVKAMGTPSKIVIYNYYEIWVYNGSNVKFIDDRVISFANGGTLKVDMGKKAAGALPFTMDSTKEEVLRAMGTSTEITWDPETNGGEWKYGYSTVNFDWKTGRVYRWFNYGNLNVSWGKADPAAPSAGLSSTKEEVLAAMGTPSEIVYGNLGNLQAFNYGKSSIRFGSETGKVVGWNNTGNLKISIGTPDPSAAPFTLGSTKDEVIKANGTPLTLEGNSWGYGKVGDIESSVTFNTDDKVMRWSNGGNLKVWLGDKDPAAPPFTLGSTSEEVLKANGTPREIILYGDRFAWVYGRTGNTNSQITFDATGKVEYWKNAGDLKASMGEIDPSAPPFWIGSTMEEVAKSNGTPWDIYSYGENGSIWYFGRVGYNDAYVKFDKYGKVKDYSNPQYLKVGLTAKDPLALPFTKGSTMEEVLKSNGTPYEVYADSYNRYTWQYRDKNYIFSSVYFDSKGNVVNWQNNGALNVSTGE